MIAAEIQNAVGAAKVRVDVEFVVLKSVNLMENFDGMRSRVESRQTVVGAQP